MSGSKIATSFSRMSPKTQFVARGKSAGSAVLGSDLLRRLVGRQQERECRRSGRRVALILMYTVNAMGLLRVSPEGEGHGLDLHEHGISAYPEYVISSVGKPAAMVIGASGRPAPQPGVQLNAIEPSA